jgi:two-component system, LytTR family, response regulator
MMKLLIKQKTKCEVICIDDIIFCSSSSNYSTIHLKDQKTITISKCLTKFSKELNEDFIRISQSFIVNFRYIVEIYPQKKQLLISTGKILDFTIKNSELYSVLEAKFKEQNMVEL